MALPGLQGTDHIGFTVPDPDEADEFFVDVIGCERVYDLGPFIHDDDWMRQQLHVHPRSVMRWLRFYRCGFGTNFEVFEWEAPGGQRAQLVSFRRGTLGFSHVLDRSVGSRPRCVRPCGVPGRVAYASG
jgi:catechol 2,3-dioxygenase-like lactoylglutathione lyase family enzyme